uniref:Uncharacterized protein n=1 Tax=Pithovirus LCPAC202 TaxID=2506592 RepID=A0A481Z6N1_9VIRU|nr:MAG: uncharacterized protein LCPAC202_01790 [Pithovirus LCPAC202]
MGNVFGPEFGKRSEQTKKRPDDGRGWLFWLTLFVIGIIILLMVYFFFLPMSPKGKLKTEEEFSLVNRIEDTILAWITIATFFITLGIIIKGFERYSVYFSLTFILMGIIMLVMGNINYLGDRQLILRNNFEVPAKLDVLFIVVIIGIIVTIFILYDVIRYEVSTGMPEWMTKS